MRTKQGTVTGTKQDKSAIVTVHTYKAHPKYKKRFRVSKKFYVHDEKNELKEGDIVIIAETKPVSKTKRWKVIENMTQAKGSIKKATPKKEVAKEEPKAEAEKASEEKV